MRVATLLSELVYRAAECSEQGFADAKADVEAQLGVELGSVARHKSGGQRCGVRGAACEGRAAQQPVLSAAAVTQRSFSLAPPPMSVVKCAPRLTPDATIHTAHA